MTSTPDFSFDFLSNPRYLCAIREFVIEFTRALGFPDLPGSQVALAVDEALTNIMKHGYERRIDGPIHLELTVLPDQGQGTGVQVIIEDEARQVEPAQIKGRDLADIRPGGLGVHIIREVMDEVRYERRPDKGMRLTMSKRVPGAAPPPSPCCCRPECPQ
jgi:serine/threonine-protein kinase RsbW